MRTVRVGVAGLGHLGRHHLRIYSDLEEADLIGGYDIDQRLAKERCGALGTKAFSKYEELLEEIDALNIVVPTRSHFEVAMSALKRGIHLLIEKPITRTIDEADVLIQEAKEQNCIIQVGHIERFNGALRTVEHLNMKPLFIESSRLAPFNPRGTDVSVIHDLMIHDVDIVLSLVKSSVEKIDAVGAGIVSQDEDIANARLLFENGCVANLTTSRIARKRKRRMHIFQHDTYIVLDFLEGQAELFRLVDSESAESKAEEFCPDFGEVEFGTKGKRILCERPLVEDEEPLKLELRSFIQTIQKGERPAVSGEDGRQALKVVHDIIEQVQVHSARVQSDLY